MEVLQWDACAEFWVESLEDWTKFRASPRVAKLLAREAILLLFEIPVVVLRTLMMLWLILSNLADFDTFIALPLKCMFGNEATPGSRDYIGVIVGPRKSSSTKYLAYAVHL